MGQVQSEEFKPNDESTQDVADSEINSKNPALKSQSTAINSKGRHNAKSRESARKLSNVSHRNIQLLSMKPRSEKDVYADGLRSRRRSSLINLILGAPSSGPRFSDDLCSLSSHHISECNFGIEFFPDVYRANTSVSSLRLESIEDLERGTKVGDGVGSDCNVLTASPQKSLTNQSRRRSSLGSLVAAYNVQPCDNPSGLATRNGRCQQNTVAHQDNKSGPVELDAHKARIKQFSNNKPNLTSTLASIDLTSSFECHDKSVVATEVNRSVPTSRPPLHKAKQGIFEDFDAEGIRTRAAKGRVNQSSRVLVRSGSELSLYSTVSASSSVSQGQRFRNSTANIKQQNLNPLHETKLIIILQVCLPFILAGFGNMAAGLMLNKVAQWQVFQKVPTFFILLPPFVGLKGNIEMTLASRLSTLSNLNLLETSSQRRRAFETNLVLILSQAIGLSMFAASVSILCELLMGSHTSADWLDEMKTASVVVFASALATSILLVAVSSIVIPLAIGLANLIQVNPDNLSTLIAALYGDVSCVLVYGIIAEWMFALREQNILIWPVSIIAITLVSWPVLLIFAHKFKETNRIALSSIPPMMASIVVSIGSGFVLALVVGRFHLIALYQPVVNGFGANLIAVQASRVSTWLWCTALNGSSNDNLENIQVIQQQQQQFHVQKTSGLVATFTTISGDIAESKSDVDGLLMKLKKFLKAILWSFFNKSPNSIAARLLLVMLVPAQTLYFLVIWLLSPGNYVVLTWQLYSIYIILCVLQVFILLTICEPFMTLLMKRDLDPDIFGISLLMALADLVGTLCLAGAFYVLVMIGDPNAA